MIDERREARDALDAQTEAERLSGDYYRYLLDREQADIERRRS